MRAVEVARFGGPEVLELRQLRDFAPRRGQAVVAAVACDVLFVDTMIHSGMGTDDFPVRPPYVRATEWAARLPPRRRGRFELARDDRWWRTRADLAAPGAALVAIWTLR